MSPARAAALALLVFALGPRATARAGAAGDCRPPAYVVQSIARAERADLVRLGRVGECGSDVRGWTRAAACFAGYVREESFPLDEAGAAAVRRMLAPRSLACETSGSADVQPFTIGFDLDGRGGPVRATLMLPSGAVEFEIPNGMRFGAALSPAGLREWYALAAAMAARAHRSPAEFASDLARDSPPPPLEIESAPPASPVWKPVVPELQAQPVTKVSPRYPDIAREAGVDGIVWVSVLVGMDGRVHETRVLKSIPMLDHAAVEAVMQWTFRPGTRGGKAVDSWLDLPVKFSLH